MGNMYQTGISGSRPHLLELPKIELVSPSMRKSGSVDRSSPELSKEQCFSMLNDLYGRRTYNVGRFQQSAGLRVTGSLDNETKTKLREVYALAFANPEDALRKGFALASHSSADEFREVARAKMAQLGGMREASQDGDQFSVAVRQFQKSVGLAPDGVVGRLTMAALDKAIVSRANAVDTNGNVSNTIPVGRDAVDIAASYYKNAVGERGYFEPLGYDISGRTSNNQGGVSALQGLLRTIGYNKAMTPGVFDADMGVYVKGIQELLVKKGLLKGYGEINGHAIQLDPSSGDAGVSPGRVGGDTFLALIRIAQGKAK